MLALQASITTPGLQNPHLNNCLGESEANADSNLEKSDHRRPSSCSHEQYPGGPLKNWAVQAPSQINYRVSIGETLIILPGVVDCTAVAG